MGIAKSLGGDMIKKLSIAVTVVASVVVLMGLFTLFSTPTLAAQPAAHAQTASSSSYQLDWDTINNGGTTMQSTSFTMYSTTGQAVITPMQGSSYTLKNGFWSGVFNDFYEIFLPMIRK
jgi:hypothetical protein